MRKRDPNFMMRSLRDAVCGAFIGAGAILPGVSGGVLAVVFDLYQPFMEILTHPKRALPKYWRFLPAIGIGWAVGFLGVANGIRAALDLSASVTTWLFIGLIVGTIPPLYREAGREGRHRASWISMALCAGLVFWGLFYAGHVANVQLAPGAWSFGLCGALFGMGVVIPGLATSSVLMALGLYQPMMQGLAQLDMAVLAPTLLGVAASVALLARLVSWVFKNYYSVAFHGIFGMVLASTLVILPTAYTGWGEVAASAACAVVGFFLAFGLGKLDRKTKES